MNDENFRVGAPPTLPGQDKKPRRSSALIGAGAVIAALFVGCCTGFGIGSMGDDKPQVQVVTTPTPVKVIEYLPAPSPVAPTEAAAPTKAAAPTIEDGIWTVGDDFPAGTYKVVTPVTRMCYWGIYKSGTNQANIIDNDIVTGGRPTVTLKRGQDFKSSGCGTWAKVK